MRQPNINWVIIFCVLLASLLSIRAFADEACFKITSFERSMDPPSPEADSATTNSPHCVAQGNVFLKMNIAPIAVPVNNIRVAHPALCEDLKSAHFSQKYIRLSPFDLASPNATIVTKVSFSESCQDILKLILMNKTIN